MLQQTSLLVSLVLLIDRLPWPSEPTTQPRGRPKTYSDRLILKALVIMIIRCLYTEQWSGQKSGGDSAVSSELLIAGMIFHIPPAYGCSQSPMQPQDKNWF